MTKSLSRFVLLAALLLYGTGITRHAHNAAVHGHSHADLSQTLHHCGGGCSAPADSVPVNHAPGECPECLMLAVNAAVWIAPPVFVVVADPPAIDQVEQSLNPALQRDFSPCAPRAPPVAPMFGTC